MTAIEDCHRQVFEAVKDRLPAGYQLETFVANLHKYQFLPIVVAGVCIGAIMCHGCEVHAAVVPQARGRWFNKSILRWLATQLRRHGKLTTKVLDGHTSGHEFATRLGFTPIDRVGNLTYYRKDEA